MIPFIIAIDADPDQYRQMRLSLPERSDAYPSIPKTGSDGGHYATVAVAVEDEAQDIRALAFAPVTGSFHQQGGLTTLLDGIAISSSGVLDAKAINADWGLLDEAEGRFVAVSFCSTSRRVQVRTDPLGLGSVYARKAGGATLISNNLGAIDHVGGCCSLDPAGMATFLALGYNVDDRTSLDGTRTISRFDTNSTGQGITGSIAELLDAPRPSTRDDLGDTGTLVVSLLDRHPRAQVNLTGGRDSRIVLALALSAGLRPDCRTRGRRGDADVEIAMALAERQGLKHELVVCDPREQVEHFDELCRVLLDRTEGTVSLWQALDVLGTSRGQVAAPPLIGGIGGEIARDYFGLAEGTDQPQRLRSKLLKKARLLTEEGRELFVGEIDRAIAALLARVTPTDLPDAFYAFHRVRRWGGANARKITPFVETFAPLATRPWLRMALTMTPAERAAEHAVHRACRDYSGLATTPFDDGMMIDRASLILRMRNMRIRQRVRPRKPAPHRLFLALRKRFRTELMDRDQPAGGLLDRRALEQAFETGHPRDSMAIMGALTLERYLEHRGSQHLGTASQPAPA